MTDDLSDSVIENIRELYQNSRPARTLFDWTANLERDAKVTSISRLRGALRLSNTDAITLARELQEAECGTFVQGRRGAKSRFVWRYSRISLGQVARGEVDELEQMNEVDPIEDENDDWEETFVEEPSGKLTIDEAKSGIARLLGIDPGQIEITIKA